MKSKLEICLPLIPRRSLDEAAGVAILTRQSDVIYATGASSVTQLGSVVDMLWLMFVF